MTLLSVDPGRVSGWALIGDEVRSGTVRIDSRKGLEHAMEIVVEASVVVIEGCGYVSKGRFDTIWGLGRRAGTWECLARVQGADVELVHPQAWQKAMLYQGRNPGRAMIKKLSQARARSEVGREVGPDEADAICMGMWFARERGLVVK